MNPRQQHIAQSRRNFLATSASGVGMLAVASLLKGEGLLAAEDAPAAAANPLAPRAPHFAPKAKNCIFIYLEG
ncbi:MAG: twin-arginine translocation signal domain-containing protein, partial [Pirellulales bacterium]